MKDWSFPTNIVACGLLVVAVWSSEWLLNSTNVAFAASDMKDIKAYGNCMVWTSVDLLTDEENPQLYCGGEERHVGFLITRYLDGGFGMGIKAGRQFHRKGKSIPVALRVYPGPVIELSGTFIGGHAFTREQQLISSLLPQIAIGGRLIVKVGTESGVIDLTGSAQAVQDFQRRMSTGQQTLEIPTR